MTRKNNWRKWNPKLARAGRRRKQGKREPNGRVQRDYANQQAYENQCVVIEARRRHLHVSQEQAKSEFAGHTMGILHMRKIITRKQLDASDAYAKAYFRLHRLKGWPRHTPKVAAYAEMIAGMPSHYETDEDEIRRAQDNWQAAKDEIVNSLGVKAALPAIQAINNFAIHQADPTLCNERRAMSLTAGLDVLVKHYGV